MNRMAPRRAVASLVAMTHSRSPQRVALTHVPPLALEQGERSFVQRTAVDIALARQQHSAYCDVLRSCGVRVVTLDANSMFPDAVFVEDTTVVLDEVAVMAFPGAASRRGEVAAVEAALRAYRPIEHISPPGTLDGGDVVVTGRDILVGASARTNAEGAAMLADRTRRFGYRVRRVPVRDCLHLKSACCALPDGRLVVNRNWLDESALDGFTLVVIPSEEPFAADFASVGNTLIVSASHPRTAERLARLGYDVLSTPLSEFEKAEGGVTCLSVIFST
jgi:dimethylargininase